MVSLSFSLLCLDFELMDILYTRGKHLLGQKQETLSKVENRGPQDDGWWRSCSFMRKLLRFAGGSCQACRDQVKGRARKKSRMSRGSDGTRSSRNFLKSICRLSGLE